VIDRMKILIDAANLRGGGGQTHLIEFLQHFSSTDFPNVSVEVWGPIETLNLLPTKDGITLHSEDLLNRGLLARSWWQRFKLGRVARRSQASIIFSPGGNYRANFSPAITMSRNMLPFSSAEVWKYFPSAFFFKLLILRWTQSQSFRRVDGLIFLCDYAKEEITKRINIKPDTVVEVIPHGLNDRFIRLGEKRLQGQGGNRQSSAIVNILYVSTIDEYKHQAEVIDAIKALRERHGRPVRLTLAGGAYPPSLKKFNEKIKKIAGAESWINYLGPVAFEQLDQLYMDSDLAVFASSCENLPNTLLEKMGAGLPIVCSSHPPMIDIARSAALFFDPSCSKSLESVLLRAIDDPVLREAISTRAHKAAQGYSWHDTVSSTIAFCLKIVEKRLDHV
jgi:glycosyltransferase involved in cell wall biosynthesis